MNKNPEKTQLSKLETALLTAMQSIDMQIAREMQRSPSQREEHGVQKWDAYQKRIENISAFLLNNIANRNLELDSLLVLSQAFAKSLQILVEELGEKGLGIVRSSYCMSAADAIARDAGQMIRVLKNDHDLV